jgi:hypothetical protein
MSLDQTEVTIIRLLIIKLAEIQLALLLVMAILVTTQWLNILQAKKFASLGQARIMWLKRAPINTFLIMV